MVFLKSVLRPDHFGVHINALCCKNRKTVKSEDVPAEAWQMMIDDGRYENRYKIMRRSGLRRDDEGAGMRVIDSFPDVFINMLIDMSARTACQPSTYGSPHRLILSL